MFSDSKNHLRLELVCGTYMHIHIHKNENDQTVENISLAACESHSHHCWSHTDKHAPCNNHTYKIKLEL